MSNDQPLISIVVPVHNGGDLFHQCLIHLKQYVPAYTEVIVVADGESDGSWKLVEPLGFRLIKLPQSGGPAKARNAGARVARGDILFFVDADVLIHAETVDRVLRAFQRHPEISALIGSYDDAPGAPNFLSQYKNLFHHYTHQQGKEDASTFWGACGAVRRDVFLAVGGFDERYRKPCIEDIELGYRLKQAGYPIRLCKDVQVKHLKEWTTLSLLRAEVFYRALPWTALLLRIRQASAQDYRNFTSDLNLKLSSRLSVVLIFAAVLMLFSTLWFPVLWLPVSVLSTVLLAINLPVYQFFYHKRGLFFALKVIPWHLLYYFYSGLAFAISLGRHHLKAYEFARMKVRTID
ncbi:MAG: glycosyltransferase [Cyanobacteria bacterium Co-bin13]|nr:glycosyltransferase [Cyanobacteria bacterium Co-bin13]